MQFRLKPIAAAVAFSVFSGLLMPQGAQAVEIGAGELDAALHGLASQTGIQVLFDANELKGVRTSGAHGAATPDQALKQLLEGTGYRFQTTGTSSFVIRHLAEIAATGRNRPELLPEVVVTATKTESKISEVPTRVTVITAEQIRQQDAKDLSDVLRKEAGIDIVRSTASGVATVSIRGGNSGTQRSIILIDGEPADFLPTGTGGKTAVQLVDPNNVERIEIVRGAGSALYGAGAMGGVVNIITKRGRPDSPQTSVSAGYDGQKTKSVGLSTNGGSQDVSYQLNAKWADSNGYKPSPDPVPLTMRHSLQDEAWRDSSIGGRIGYWLTDRNEIGLTLNHLSSRNNIYGRPNTWTDVKNTVYGVESRNWISDDYLLTANLSYRNHKADNDFDSYFIYPGFPSMMDTTRTSILREGANRLVGEVKNQWDINPSNRLLFGLSYGKDGVDLKYWNAVAGTQDDSRTGDVKNTALYVQDEIKASDKFFVTLGARWDTFDYSLQYTNLTTTPVTLREVNKQWNTVNPRAALRYNLTEATSLRGSAGTGFRAPDTWALMGGQLMTGIVDLRPNTNLNAEKSVNYDLGIDQKFGAGTNVSLTAYRSTIKDAIAMTSFAETGLAMGVRQWQNIGEVQNSGAELELKSWFGDEWLLFANYTYNVSEVTASAGALNLPEKGKKLNLSPANKLAAGVVYTLAKQFTARLDGRYVGRQYQLNDMQNTPDNLLLSYTVADVKLTWNLPMDKSGAELSVGARNLFDKKYATASIGEYAEPRTVFVQLGYSRF